MKNILKILSFLVLLTSCKDKEAEALKALNTLEGKWVIDKVELSKLSNEIVLEKITGTIDLQYCKKTTKALASPNYVCKGAAKFNEKEFIFTYRYDNITKILKLLVLPQEIGTAEEQNISIAMTGDWKVENLTSNTLFANKVPNSNKNIAVSFTAKK